MERVWKRRECLSAEVGDELWLFDAEAGLFHSLNRTASAVWMGLGEVCTETELVERLTDRYNVSVEECRLSVRTLLTRWQRNNLVSSQATES